MSSSTPAEVLTLELCPVADLRPYHRNPRRGDVAQIARSLKRTGQYRPIVANKGTHTGRPGEVLAGNHTLAAARDRLGWAAIWTTWVDVDDDTAARIVAADNRTAELGGYDDAELVALLQQVQAGEQGLEGTGYDDAELLALIERTTPRPEREGDPDAIPDEPAEPVTRPGDVWQLGDHRIMCGDSTDPEQVAWLVGDRKAQLLHADPPYGMGKAAEGVLGDNTYGAELDAFQLRWWDTWRPHLEDNATPKPVAMLARAITSSTPPGALVFEPFAGTGSTLIAADDTGRVCYTMEIHPPYVDTAVLRWQLRTGGTPLRNGTPLLLEG